MCGEGARHPTPAIQRIVPHFNLNFIVIFFIKKIRYLAFCFWKSLVQKIYIYTCKYLFIYKVACEYLLQRII